MLSQVATVTKTSVTLGPEFEIQDRPVFARCFASTNFSKNVFTVGFMLPNHEPANMAYFSRNQGGCSFRKTNIGCNENEEDLNTGTP